MNYDELMVKILAGSKALKDGAAAVTKQQKTLDKNVGIGNLAEVKKTLTSLEEAMKAMLAGLEETKNLAEGFDTQEYFVSGEFTRQLLEKCEEKKIDVQGEKGVYQMFPYKIRVIADEEHAPEVWMDRKKVSSIRPEYVAETIRTGQAKLYAANFNVQNFMSELAEAYESARLRTTRQQDGSTIELSKIYKYLAPTARAKKDYDAVAFAFDLARAYEKGPEAWVTKKGERFDLGTSRNGSGYRVLSSTGVETFISTLRHVLNSGD